MNKLFTQLVEKRHLSDDFIHPKYEHLTNPKEMPDMEKATNRIEQAIKNQEKILIYGDYDVDGVTASTLMENALILAGIEKNHLEIMLPDRFVDGYGMSSRLITRAKDHGITLVITVDCGSRNAEIIDELNHEHIDTIVTDHHECGETLPNAIAVINPKRPDFTGPATLRNLAGVGVAFKVAESLRDRHLIPAGQEKWLLDLVLLGTICDSMLLTGENRILSFYGCVVLAKTRRPGLRALMKNAKVTDITADSIGFQIGPRLNAAGRLTTAETALNLLRATSRVEAVRLAAELEELNRKRRDEQNFAMREINERGLTPGSVIIETGKWHEGVLGIIAGRLVEKYHRPAFVLSEVENGICKGSGRSFGDFNLASALGFAKDAIISGGGHAGAAGVRLETGKLYEFREKINAYYDSLHLTNQERYFKSSAEIETADASDFDFELIENLGTLEPFGPGNDEPLFCLKNASIHDFRRMGKDQNHLRLDLQGLGGHTIKSIAFSAPKAWFAINQDATHDFIIRPTINEWQGTRSVESRLIDIL